MEQVVIVGNCQAGALEMMLNTNDEFAARFEFVSFPPVHEIPDELVPELHQAVAAAAIVMPQRVDEAYRGGIGLGSETLTDIASTSAVVRWPSLYWAGYVPDLFYLRDAAGAPVLDGAFDYHDRTILQAYAADLDVAGACRVLEDPERPSIAPSWAAEATAELATRGSDCDIEVATFITASFRDELLFFTMNHPTNRLLGHVAQEITKLLGIPGDVDQRRILDEILGSTFYPLHANDVRALSLTFGERVRAGCAPFTIRGTRYEPSEAVQAFYDYYTEHPHLVELNLASLAV